MLRLRTQLKFAAFRRDYNKELQRHSVAPSCQACRSPGIRLEEQSLLLRSTQEESLCTDCSKHRVV